MNVFAVPSIVLVLIAGLGTIVVLLAYRKTRPAGLALLSIGLLALLVGGLMIMWWRVHSFQPGDTESRVPIATIPLDAPIDEVPASDVPVTALEKSQSAREDVPPWVGLPPRWVGGVYQVTITTDPFATAHQCERALPGVVEDAIAQYIQTELRFEPRIARKVKLPGRYVRDDIVKQKWTQPVQTSFGQWTQLHALLEFDHKAAERIEEECKAAIVTERLWYAGTGVAGALVLLALLFVTLKINR